MLVEVVDYRIAQRSAHFVDEVDVFAIHFQADLIGADGQAGMEIVALLVCLDLIVALNVFTVDFHQGALQRLSRRIGNTAIDGTILRHTRHDQKERSEGGFRLYSCDDLAALQFICSLQTLGFSLNEIREFLPLRTNDLRACSAVQNMLDRKLKAIHAKRIALAKLECELKAALTKCNAQLKRSNGKNNGRCPVLTVFDKSKHKGAE